MFFVVPLTLGVIFINKFNIFKNAILAYAVFPIIAQSRDQ